MPTLDVRGKIAAAEIAFYAPIAALSIFLVARYALRRDAGWLFLALFSLTRMTTGALTVAAQMTASNPSLFSAAYVMDPAGLSLLLLSTIGFLGMAGQHTYSEIPRVTVIFRLFGVLGLAGLALTIAGGVLGTSAASNENVGMILRRAGAGIYAGLWVLLLLAFFGTFTYRWHLRSYRRNLLYGISMALPFLGARVAYGILAAWSSADLFGKFVSTDPVLAKLNPITGQWVFYLVLDLVMEFLTAVLFLFASTVMARRYH